jgi:beta-galactosidase
MGPGRALVSIETSVRNVSANSRARLYLSTAMYDKDGALVGEDSIPLTVLKNEESNVRQRIFIKEAKLWDPDRPYLYTCKSRIMAGDETLDSAETIFGVRSLSLDRENGLSVNGNTVKLRGACIHHDNGVIGAAAIERAEERRVEKLKEAGFNAIRSAHHPASRALLNACVRLGMFVMDETFDAWTESKRPFDYALDFPEWWGKDVEAMIAKDFNHPSVIIYSIGNEINECCTQDGGVWSRRIAG